MLMFFVPIFVLILLFLATMPKEKAKQNLPGWQHRAQKELDIIARRNSWQFGWLWQCGGAWIGVHYSKQNRRFCVNLVPCLTFWAARPGGKTPHTADTSDEKGESLCRMA